MNPLWKRAVRIALRDTLRVYLRIRSRSLTFDSSGSLVIVSPHPDDDALGCSGLIQAALAAGTPVKIVYLTDGGGSHPNHPAVDSAQLAGRRRAEAIAAAQHLGLRPDHLAFLGAMDGTLAHLSPAESHRLATALAAEIDRADARIVTSPCRADASTEHDAAFVLLQQALRLVRVPPRVLEYPIWSWWNPLRLPGAWANHRRVWRVPLGLRLDLKRRALAAHRTQLEPLPPWTEPVLSTEFTAAFLRDAEYFFEA